MPELRFSSLPKFRPASGLTALLGLAIGGAALLLGARRYREGLLLAGAAHATFCTTAAIPNHPLTGPLVRRFRTESREVWLTIDDGPHPDTTPGILETLRRHGAKATFFVIGRNAANHPELLQAIVRDGHSLGNHTASHPAASFWSAGPGRIAREIDGATAAVESAGLPAPRYFRSPVGMTNLFVAPALANRGLLRIGWSSRAFDTRPQSPAAVVTRIMRTCRPGAIILLHERGPAAAGRSLGPLLIRLEENGYRCILPPDDALIVEGACS
ncbi:MAG TPA: polysaccharide deacetylase family protein [Chthoniobacterales bacterium]|jgi:peptidoglycan/xylan/chitin deacetylase (PgdA/CDA1 family)